jgi:hypothetical protein
MGKAGEKQKRRPKIKDARQSERFRETARKIGANENSDAFDRIVDEMARPKRPAGGPHRKNDRPD